MGFRVGQDGASDGAGDGVGGGARVGGSEDQGPEPFDRRPGQPENAV